MAATAGTGFATEVGKGGGTGISRAAAALSTRGKDCAGDSAGADCTVGTERIGEGCDCPRSATAGVETYSVLATHHAAALATRTTPPATAYKTQRVRRPTGTDCDAFVVDRGVCKPGNWPICRSVSAFFSASRMMDMTYLFSGVLLARIRFFRCGSDDSVIDTSRISVCGPATPSGRRPCVS